MLGAERRRPIRAAAPPRTHDRSRHTVHQRAEHPVKITDIRTRVVEWRGATAPPQPHFCTNPIDILQLSGRRAAAAPTAPGGEGSTDPMAGFRFHGWLIVEIFTDAGHV